MRENSLVSSLGSSVPSLASGVLRLGSRVSRPETRNPKPETSSSRISAVDAVRGFAVLLMVFYHIFFDLSYLGFAQINLSLLPLLLLQRITGFLFVFIAGFSVVLSETRNKEVYKKGYLHHLKRAGFLALVAILITVVTWIYSHEGFIKFGIIHLLALSTAIAPFFFRFGYRVNAVLGLAVILVGLWAGSIIVASPYLFWFGFVSSTYMALDHYPLLPWFGAVLLGVSVAFWALENRIIERLSNVLVPRWLSGMGRNSLAIYLAHQPIILAILFIFARGS